MTAAVTPEREGLKPCPFCSSEDVELSCTESNWPAVRCNECGTLGPCTDLHSDKAIEAWNARPTTRPTSELDAASNACLELCSHHSFATGHGDTVADIIREIDVQITERLAAKPADEGVDYSFDLRETLKAVLEHFGVDGAAKVTRHVMMARRSRDSNAEIDRLEELFSTTGEPKL